MLLQPYMLYKTVHGSKYKKDWAQIQCFDKSLAAGINKTLEFQTLIFSNNKIIFPKISLLKGN